MVSAAPSLETPHPRGGFAGLWAWNRLTLRPHARDGDGTWMQKWECDPLTHRTRGGSLIFQSTRNRVRTSRLNRGVVSSHFIGLQAHRRQSYPQAKKDIHRLKSVFGINLWITQKSLPSKSWSGPNPTAKLKRLSSILSDFVRADTQSIRETRTWEFAGVQKPGRGDCHGSHGTEVYG